ncbi:MAG: ABC transporter permease subunit [Pseudomonadota bacterium]
MDRHPKSVLSPYGGVGRTPGPVLTAAMAMGLLAALIAFLPPPLRDVPDALIVPLPRWVTDGLEWLVRGVTVGGVTLQDVTRVIARAFEWPIDALMVLLSEGVVTGAGFNKTQVAPPLSWLGVIIAAGWLAWRVAGRPVAALTAFAGAYLVTFGFWPSAMATLSSVLLCVVITMALGLLLGIQSYRSPGTENVTRGVMNVMQTVPIFSYLIPTLLLFGYGPSAALFATIVYALPPIVHATVLALKALPSEIRELAQITGCTRRQTLWRVEMPVAVPGLAIGLNQVVMMTLNMVIIASMIGAGGLGYDVLRALRRLDIGAGLQAGLAIVVLAIVLDRITQAMAVNLSQGRKRVIRRWDAIGILGVLVAATALSLLVPALSAWPQAWTLSTAGFWNDLVEWINRNAFDVLEAVRTTALLYAMYPLRDLLLALPYPVVILGLAALGGRLGGPRVALTVGALMTFIAIVGYWDAAMVSAYLVAISVFFALLIGGPLGVWIANRPRLHEPARLALDTLQTLPTLVYLLPAVMLFRNGDFSALIAVLLYALAPAVRYTMQGLRTVPTDRLEAAEMAGATPWQKLRLVQLPSAAPTLILGLNQTIMMALSMLIIAALVGTRELGQEVFTALSRGDTGEGVVAGLCVAALALTCDAILKSWSARLRHH